MTLILGIDPGKDGGAALMDSQLWLIFTLSFKYTEYWERRLYDWCRSYDPTMFVEDVHAFPGQGVKSMFTFGHELGRIDAVHAITDVQRIDVQPERWQMELGLPMHRNEPDPVKRRALRRKDQKAQALAWYPELAKVKGDIYAAVLIARYGVKYMME